MNVRELLVYMDSLSEGGASSARKKQEFLDTEVVLLVPEPMLSSIEGDIELQSLPSFLRLQGC